MLLQEIVQSIQNEVLGDFWANKWLANVENFWLSPKGEWKKCYSHAQMAKDMSNITYDADLAYEWMFQHGWAKVIREGDRMWVSMSRFKTNHYKLTKEQKDALREKGLYGYPKKLEISSDLDQPLDLYERL